MNILCWKLCMILFYKVRIMKGTLIKAVPYFTKRNGRKNIHIEFNFVSMLIHIPVFQVSFYSPYFFSFQTNILYNNWKKNSANLCTVWFYIWVIIPSWTLTTFENLHRRRIIKVHCTLLIISASVVSCTLSGDLEKL